MEKNYEWFLNANLSRYEGQYVAIAREQVVAFGEDPGQVYETAKQCYPSEEILLWKVIPTGTFVFLICRRA